MSTLQGMSSAARAGAGVHVDEGAPAGDGTPTYFERAATAFTLCGPDAAAAVAASSAALTPAAARDVTVFHDLWQSAMGEKGAPHTTYTSTLIVGDSASIAAWRTELQVPAATTHGTKSKGKTNRKKTNVSALWCHRQRQAGSTVPARVYTAHHGGHDMAARVGPPLCVLSQNNSIPHTRTHT